MLDGRREAPGVPSGSPGSGSGNGPTTVEGFLKGFPILLFKELFKAGLRVFKGFLRVPILFQRPF